MPFRITVHNLLMILCCLSLVWICPNKGIAQELEPRSLVNLPVGTNFVLAGYGFLKGNILLDPAVPIENLDAELHTFIGAYVRAVNIFGNSAKLNVVLPFASGYWSGLYTGVYNTASRSGLGDLRLGLAYNFVGSPALGLKEFKSFQQKTVVGANIWASIPIGQYYPDKLVNLGSNRFAFRSQLGISHTLQKWIFESYISLWVFTRNNKFWNGKKLEQNPLLGVSTHVIRLFGNGMWLAGDAGYGVGGTTVVNDVRMDSHISTFRFGLTYSIPLAKKHSLKLTAVSSARIEQGPDFDAFTIAYQYRW